MEATTSDEEAVQLEALRQLQAAEVTPEIARALRHLVESSDREGPTRGAAGHGRAGPGPRPAHPGGPRREEARVALDRRGGGDRSRPRHVVAPWGPRHLQGVAGAEGRRAAGTKEPWRPPTSLQRVALAGLERIGGEEADELLDRLAEMGEDEVAAEADVVIERRGGSSGG